MRKFAIIFFLLPLVKFIEIDSGSHLNSEAPVKDSIATRPPHFANLLGYVKTSSSFSNATACALTNMTQDVWSNTRTLGQIGIGDVIFQDEAGSVPLDGGYHWWGFSTTYGGNPTRSMQIGADGTVLQISACVANMPGGKMVPFAYISTTHTANCSNTNFTEALYADPTDMTMYNNKQVYTSDAGGFLADGSYTASSTLGGSSTWTFSSSSFQTRVTSLACCTSLPTASAGPDQTASLPSPSITLSGSGSDCDGSITLYDWTQISGPNAATITTASSPSTTITGVVAGTYVFQLEVTDNSLNTATDQITVTVFPPPVCGTDVQKIDIPARQCFGLSHQMTTAIKGIPGRSFGHAKVAFDGDADPMHGNFDMDASTPGVQTDLTSVLPQIFIHDMFRLGRNQMAFLVKLDRVYNIDRFYYYFRHDHAGKDGLAGVDVFIGSRTKIRSAIFQFMHGNVAPDFTLYNKTASGWDSVKNIQLSGQYILLLYNGFDLGYGKVNADYSSFLFYGCQKTPEENDTHIGPFWNMTFTKDQTKLTEDGLSGVNEAFPIPTDTNYYKLNLGEYTDKRSYSSMGDPSAGGGILDKYAGPWSGEASTPNAIDLAPYGGGALNSPWINSKNFVSTGRRVLQTDRVMNQYLWNQLGNRPEIKEHLPVNALGDDKRFFSSWDRWSYQQKILALKFGPDNNPNGYPYVRLVNDPWPGQLGMNLWDEQEIGNEWNAGFRAANDSNYLDPWSMGVMMYVTYNAIKSVAPNMKVVIGGAAAWDMEHYWAMEMLLQIYFGEPTKVYDIWNMHTIIVTKQFVVNEGFLGNVNLNGALPGLYGERRKLIGFIDTLTYVSGFYRGGFLSEVSYTSNRYGPQAASGEEVYISTIGAPGYPQHEYSIEVNQAIAYDQMDEHYSSVPGVLKKYDYEIRDHVDRIAHPEWYARADASNGKQFIDGTPKASLYYDRGKKIRFKGWRSNRVLIDSNRKTWLHERIKPASPDSVCWTTNWQDTLDATSPRIFVFPAGVTSVKRVRFSFNSINPEIEETISIPGGVLIWTPDQRSDHFFFKLPAVLPDNKYKLPGIKYKSS